MEIRQVIKIQLPTTGRSVTFLLPGTRALVRQDFSLMIVDLNQRKVATKIDMPCAYSGQPATCYQDHYYELNGSLSKINLSTQVAEEVPIDVELSPVSFFAFDKVLMVLSNEDLFCTYLDTMETSFVCRFVSSPYLFQYSPTEMAAVHGGKLHVANLENHEVVQKDLSLHEAFSIRCGESDFIQVTDNVELGAFSFASKSSYRQAKPYFNQQYLILADQNGLLEVLQSPTFAQTTQFSNNLRFSRQVMAPQQSKKEEKEVTSKDVYLKNLNSIISWINIVKAHAQKQTAENITMDQNSQDELLNLMAIVGVSHPQKTAEIEDMQKLLEQKENTLTDLYASCLDMGNSNELPNLLTQQKQLDHELQTIRAQKEKRKEEFARKITELENVKAKSERELKAKNAEINKLNEFIKVKKDKEQKIAEMSQKPKETETEKSKKKWYHYKAPSFLQRARMYKETNAKLAQQDTFQVKLNPVQSEKSIAKNFHHRGLSMQDRIALFSKTTVK
ncbi:Conserved_hypothetical protein [Hexamita inflata]|uniref:Uncharacterized protein n=1 Tax=Hexamita inflata TaxID=28002 RepID=A0AA86PYS6_9EUKA|nr:Conserved hypothetical protein [Hexamita inflata]